ncbi:hypothetical protein KDK95_10200 [Actinospica sp. MGRD01-02]|uniref:Secreted protein n=1 Tax=Actinospica acidithermotolerans TaxID=2828514 RepID=A0A941ECU3_9ACTN|nr:hypothetical protein [Actinospica acidithermotolerans]MBR7826674.1 hypothetical protein [Actinospica acidithermotolerans]
MSALATAIVVFIIILAGAAAYLRWQAPGFTGHLLPSRRSSTRQLRARYGREYDRLYAQHGDHDAVERELSRRERERARLEIRPLDPEDRVRLVDGWTAAQVGFIDDPGDATRRAQQLIGEAMALLGYPSSDDPERQLGLVSVDHAHALADFREGHELMQRSHTGSRDVDATEQLRQAMLRFRVLFDDLVGVGARAQVSTPAREKVAA